METGLSGWHVEADQEEGREVSSWGKEKACMS